MPVKTQKSESKWFYTYNEETKEFEPIAIAVEIGECDGEKRS